MINTKSKEHLLNAVLEYCEDIVTVKDLSLRYLACNKAFCKLIGYKDDKNIPIFTGEQGREYINRFIYVGE